jgi:hypothetical protein
MPIQSTDGRFLCEDPILEAFHNSRENPIEATCIKDNPPMRGFGRQLKTGDVVVVDGTVFDDRFRVAVPSECAFYAYEYFEPRPTGQGKGE